MIQRRLQKKSPWYQSILDPRHGADVKIPDETGVETGTLQLVQQATAVTNANGICGIRMCCPWVNSGNASVSQTTSWNYQTVAPNQANIAGVDWGGPDPVAPSTFKSNAGYAFSGVDELKVTTNSHRVVSAALYVQPEPSGLDNKGEYALFHRPYKYFTGVPYENMLNMYKSVAIPLSSEDPVGEVRWYPLMSEDWSFKSFVPTVGTVPSDECDSDGAYPTWTMGFVTSGVPAGVTFRVCMVVNYEFIPLFNTLNIVDVSPSPADAQEVDLVMNWTQGMDVASSINPRKVESSPSTVPMNHGENDEGTGFGMLFNIISELAPLALAFL